MTTWREASIRALEGAGPLRIDAITARIAALGLRELTGNTPEMSVGAQLYIAVQDNDPRIRLVEPGVFEHTGSTEHARVEGNLGRLEFINPRDVWPDEARHFTPWLFDNADYLSQVLGIEVELERREHPVGTFSLDLFGRDKTHECPLIIENQLEETDHRHLGQLMTYAAGTDAFTVVWVAPRFRNEHRDALNYLNTISTGEARFFGVELKVAVIGDSDPAPHFALAAQPSDWRVQARTQRGSSEVSGVRAAYLDFWTRYLDRLHSEHPGVSNVRAPQSQNWMNLNFFRRLVIVGAFGSGSEMRCELYIDVGDPTANLQLFEALRARQAEIETAVGEPLKWDDLDGKKACRISCTRTGNVNDDDTEGHADWLLNHHLKFREVFVPIVEALPSHLWEAKSPVQ